VSSFKDCALAFRFSVIDRLPEPPAPHMVKGTLVHSALEGLFWNHERGARTPEAARASLDEAWRALQDDPEFAVLGLSAPEREAFLTEAETPSTPWVSSSSSRPTSAVCGCGASSTAST